MLLYISEPISQIHAIWFRNLRVRLLFMYFCLCVHEEQLACRLKGSVVWPCTFPVNWYNEYTIVMTQLHWNIGTTLCHDPVSMQLTYATLIYMQSIITQPAQL